MWLWGSHRGGRLTVCVTSSLGVLSLYIYETNETRDLIPSDWHDSGILAPNAAVLIAVFALRLSAGGGVMFARSDRLTGEEEGGEGVRERGNLLPGLDFKGLCWCEFELFNYKAWVGFLLTTCEWVRYSCFSPLQAAFVKHFGHTNLILNMYIYLYVFFCQIHKQPRDLYDVRSLHLLSKYYCCVVCIKYRLISAVCSVKITVKF